ncbi:MAG: hypothetical protein U0X39_09740 [Bacteroidales bacterium]
MNGLVFNIRRYSIHDGPGIRSRSSSRDVNWLADGVITLKE